MASSAAGAVWRTALWLVLGGWIGSWAAFGLLFTPVLFSRAPEAAGALIGPVLTGLHLYGAAAGGVLAGLAWVRGRGGLRVALPLALAAICLASQLGISSEIAELRDRAFAAGGSQELAARFHHLHRISLALFVGVGIGAVGLVGLHARSDAGEARA